MRRFIAIFFAILLMVSVVYAPNPNDGGGQGNNRQRSDRPPEHLLTRLELQINYFDFSNIKPEAERVLAYELTFPDSNAVMNEINVFKLYFSDSGVFYKDTSENEQELTLDPNNPLKVFVAGMLFYVYQSDNINGKSAFVFQDSRENSKNPILYLEDDSRYAAIAMYQQSETEGSYRFASSELTTEERQLTPGSYLGLKIVKEEEPREQVQHEVDLVSLEQPLSGCADKDKGINEASTPSWAHDTDSHAIYDFCAYGNNKEVLHEAYCNEENKVDVKEIVCQSKCKNGACVTTESADEGNNFCVDTDQREEKKLPTNSEEISQWYGSKGATIGFYISKESKYSLWEDYCTQDGSKLVEHSCKGNKVSFSVITCACSEGKCQNPPYCMDTDGGDNVKVKGKVVGADSSMQYFMNEDSCNSDSTKVIEYSCDSTGSKTTEIECEFGCSEGKCRAESEPTVDQGSALVEEQLVTEVVEQPVVEQPVVDQGSAPVEEQLVTEVVEQPVVEQAQEQNIQTEAQYNTELQSRRNILNDLESIIRQAEALHANHARKANGQSCAVPGDCQSGYCNPATKVCGIQVNVALARQLLTNRANDIACTQSSQCQSGYCGNIQSSTGRGTCANPTRKVNGARCSLDNECASSRCSYGNLGAVATGKICITPMANNAACRLSTQCQSNYCNPSHRCASQPARQVNPAADEIQLPRANMFA